MSEARFNPIAHKPRADPPTIVDRLDAICERLDRLIALLEKGNSTAEWSARQVTHMRRRDG